MSTKKKCANELAREEYTLRSQRVTANRNADNKSSALAFTFRESGSGEQWDDES